MLAIIGGTGLSGLEGFEHISEEAIKTPYGQAKVRVQRYICEGREFFFLPRHGKKHDLPPHLINYRANIWALKEAGVDNVIAVNAIGGIHPSLGPGNFAVPDQLVDYSYGRDGTFFDGKEAGLEHIDFTHPYDQTLRALLLDAAGATNKLSKLQHHVMDGGVYGCTQGPRLETAAEITRLERDGCDMVGMTSMPEAALARELGLAYACFALSVNWAAGLSDEAITLDEIHRVLDEGMGFVALLLKRVTEESY